MSQSTRYNSPFPGFTAGDWAASASAFLAWITASRRPDTRRWRRCRARLLDLDIDTSLEKHHDLEALAPARARFQPASVGPQPSRPLVRENHRPICPAAVSVTGRNCIPLGRFGRCVSCSSTSRKARALALGAIFTGNEARLQCCQFLSQTVERGLHVAANSRDLDSHLDGDLSPRKAMHAGQYHRCSLFFGQPGHCSPYGEGESRFIIVRCPAVIRWIAVQAHARYLFPCRPEGRPYGQFPKPSGAPLSAHAAGLACGESFPPGGKRPIAANQRGRVAETSPPEQEIDAVEALQQAFQTGNGVRRQR